MKKQHNWTHHLLILTFILFVCVMAFTSCDIDIILKGYESPAHEHTIAIDESVVPTCTQTGLTSGAHCLVCGEIIVAQESIAKTDHTESEWIIDEKATTTLSGQKHTQCTVCGTVLREESIPTVEENINESAGLEFMLNIDGNSYALTGIGTCTDTDIVIPNTYNGKPVTSFGDIFDGCNNLTSIVIPNSVTHIYSYAFRNCSSLTSIVIPNSITSIGADAFYNCSSLTSVHITDIEAWLNINYSYSDDAAYSYANPCSYGADLYLNNQKIIELIIPESVTNIKSSAFRGCKSITCVTIPNTITSIEGYAFDGCRNLTTVVIPSSITHIGECAFYDCRNVQSVYITDIESWLKISFTYYYYRSYYSNPCFYGADLYLNNEKLTDLVIPDSITNISDYMFRGCSSLTNIVIPDGVKSIGDYAFFKCSGLTSVVIPDSVTHISERAFSSCTNLTNVTIGNNVKGIGEAAFAYCSSLTSVVIPDSVTGIGDKAFRDCDRLTSITFEGTIEQWNNISKGDYWCSGILADEVTCSDGTAYI